MPFPKFPVGTPVRVKPGTVDPDFPDFPLDGWTGTVAEVDAPNYLIRWNHATMDQVSPTYEELCESEGLEMQSMWLDEADLELDSSASSGDSSRRVGSLLVPVDDPAGWKEGQTSEGHAPWIINSGVGDAFEFFSDMRSRAPRRRMSFTRALTMVLVGGGVLGMVLGSLLASLEITRYLAAAGAVLFGLLGLVSGLRLGRVVGTLSRVRRATFWGSVVGFTAGALLGALLGAIFVAVAGVFLGAIVGGLAARLVLGGSRRVLLTSLGAVIGAGVQAFLVDEEQALWGAVYGGAIGISAALLAVVGAKLVVGRYRRR